MNFFELRDDTNYLIGFYRTKALFRRLNIEDKATQKRIIAELKHDYQTEFGNLKINQKTIRKAAFRIYLRTLE